MASRKLEDLHVKIQPLAARHIKECKAAGIDLLIYCTYRSPAEQKELYAQGRTKPGKIVTKTLKSNHNHEEAGKPAALAYDCIALINGKAQWDNAALARKVGEIGEKIGLTWGGRWKMRDTPHFEIKL